MAKAISLTAVPVMLKFREAHHVIPVLLQALSCFPFPQATKTDSSSNRNTRPLCQEEKVPVTTRCISVGKREALTPSPGSSTTSCLRRCCSHPWPADHPAAPGSGTHGAASPRGKASSAERRGDDPQALLKRQTKRHLISARRAITYARSQLLFLLSLIPLL